MEKSKCIQRHPEGGYVFRIFPSNNKSQYLGQSTKIYPSEKECRDAFDCFIDLVAEHKITDESFVKIKSHSTQGERGILTQWTFHFYDESGCEVFARTMPYCEKVNCVKGIAAVVRYVKELK